MGGTAIGMRNKGSINMANPASYTSIDSMCFMFEVGMMGKVSNYTNSQNAQKTSFTGNIEFNNESVVRYNASGCAGRSLYV